MKILFSLIFIHFLLEFIEAGGIQTQEVNIPDDGSICNSTGTELICDFTGSDKQYNVHVSGISTNSGKKLKIIRAHTVSLTDQSINYTEITLENCSDVLTRSSKPSNYRLILVNSSASCIKETVKYFQSEMSQIKTLVLYNTDEFDISNSEIGTLNALSGSLTPSIKSSTVTKLDLEITGNSKLRIENSTIKMIKKLKYASVNNCMCLNSTIQSIPKNSIEISDGEMVFKNVKFFADNEAFKVKKGKLVFDNISKGLSSENVILESDGLFLLRLRDDNRVFTMSFDIEEEFNNGGNNNTFFPLEKVMLKDHTLLISLSLLGLVIFLTILVITLYVVYKKYTLNKKNSENSKSFDQLIMNKKEQEGVNKNNVRYSKRDKEMNKENKNNDELDLDKQRVNESYYNDSQPSPGQKIFPFQNNKTDMLLMKDKNVFEASEEGYNETGEYSEPDILNQQEPEMYSEVDVQGTPDDAEVYSELNYPSELNQKLYYNQVTNPNSDNLSSNDVYSDSNYPSVKVNELKEHLKKVGFNNAQLHSPYQRPKQINTNTQNECTNPKLFPKPTNIPNIPNQNPQIGKEKVPNFSFLSRNKDQLGKFEPPKILPIVKPLPPQQFRLNKSQHEPILPKRSPDPAKTQPSLPVQTTEEEEEENYYEEFNED